MSGLNTAEVVCGMLCTIFDIRRHSLEPAAAAGYFDDHQEGRGVCMCVLHQLPRCTDRYDRQMWWTECVSVCSSYAGSLASQPALYP